MRVLYVCTANICRSASAQQLLREAVASAPELVGIEVRSAGTAALTGAPGCSVAPALVGHAHEHQSQPLTPELVAWADLILPAARDHRRAILEMDPTSRTRTFTVRQAARIADWLVASGMVAAAREMGQGPSQRRGGPSGSPRETRGGMCKPCRTTATAAGTGSWARWTPRAAWRACRAGPSPRRLDPGGDSVSGALSGRPAERMGHSGSRETRRPLNPTSRPAARATCTRMTSQTRM